MSFAPPKVEEKETNITKPIIPSLKLDEIKDEEDLDQEGKIEGKTNVQQGKKCVSSYVALAMLVHTIQVTNYV